MLGTNPPNVTQLRGKNEITIQHCIEIDREEIIVGREQMPFFLTKYFGQVSHTTYMRTSKFDRVWVNSYLSYIGTIISNFIGTAIWSFKDSTSQNPRPSHRLGPRLLAPIECRHAGIYGLGESISGDFLYEKPVVQSTYVGSVATMVPESCVLGYVFKYDIIWTSSLRGQYSV